MVERMHNRIGDDVLLDLLHRREDLIHQSADAIDNKAGQVLAAAAFLATQSTFLLGSPKLTEVSVGMQVGSLIVCVVSVFFALLVLRITAYPTPGISEAWRDEQVMYAPPGSSEKDIHGTILWEAVNQAKERVKEAGELNESKTTYLQVAQALIVLALILNCSVLAKAYFSSPAS